MIVPKPKTKTLTIGVIPLHDTTNGGRSRRPSGRKKDPADPGPFLRSAYWMPFGEAVCTPAIRSPTAPPRQNVSEYVVPFADVYMYWFAVPA